jgi:hypothetical protein
MITEKKVNIYFLGMMSGLFLMYGVIYCENISIGNVQPLLYILAIIIITISYILVRK